MSTYIRIKPHKIVTEQEVDNFANKYPPSSDAYLSERALEYGVNLLIDKCNAALKTNNLGSILIDFLAGNGPWREDHIIRNDGLEALEEGYLWPWRCLFLDVLNIDFFKAKNDIIQGICAMIRNEHRLHGFGFLAKGETFVELPKEVIYTAQKYYISNISLLKVPEGISRLGVGDNWFDFHVSGNTQLCIKLPSTLKTLGAECSFVNYLEQQKKIIVAFKTVEIDGERFSTFKMPRASGEWLQRYDHIELWGY